MSGIGKRAACRVGSFPRLCLLEKEDLIHHRVSTEPWNSAFTVSPVDCQPVAFSLVSRQSWMVGCDESGAPATLEVSWAAENSRFLSSSFPCSTARCGNLNLRLFCGLFCLSASSLRSHLLVLHRSDGTVNNVYDHLSYYRIGLRGSRKMLPYVISDMSVAKTYRSQEAARSPSL